MPTKEQLQEWNIAFSRIERVDDYQKMKSHYKSLCEQIESLKEETENFQTPRNPREDAKQVHDKVTLGMIIKHKSRMEKQLEAMEKVIANDMEAAKQETYE